jgi:hypothetical protein
MPASTLLARHCCSDRGACGFVLVDNPGPTPIQGPAAFLRTHLILIEVTIKGGKSSIPHAVNS